MSKIIQSNKKERLGWYIYDWANSAFSTTVITVFIGPYLSSIAANAADPDGNIFFFGIKIFSESLYPYLISLSVFLQLLLLPFIGAIADQYNIKKQLLGIFTGIGSIATIMLYYLSGSNYMFGSEMFLIANVCFGAAMVVYNSFLSELAENEWRDQVSSIGWGIGYLGGGILLLINLIIYTNADKLFAENPDSMAIRVCLASAGVWWALFSVFPMLWLKNHPKSEITESSSGPILISFHKLLHTIRDLKNERNALLFLVAFIFYNDGVQAVITLSAQFGQREIGLSSDIIVTAVLLVQFVAFLGALLFRYIAKPFGSKKTIMLLICIWTLAVVFAFSVLDSAEEFFILAIIIALGMGGIQALSRAMYSRIIPPHSTAEYFSIYELSEKGSSMLGPLAFALAVQYTHSYRLGILSLIIFFILGFILLIKVKDGRHRNENI